MHHDAGVPRRARFRRGAAALTLLALTGGTALTGASAATAAGSQVLAGKACTPTEGFSGCRLFDPTGAREDFQVPAGVTALDVRAWGQGGEGTPFANGGAGGYTAGTLSVTPGEKLSVAVGVQRFGDALGGAGGGRYAAVGGNSSGVRSGDGKPLLIAAGGGGGGYGDVEAGQGGPGGGERGQDDTESERGGKGAAGPTGGAGGGNGSAGADASGGGKGGAGGSGAHGYGGGGGAGHAGGGGGGGTDEERGLIGSGAGGSSYVDPDRVKDARLLTGSRTVPPAKNDPFWQSSGEPVRGGIAEGGLNTDRSGDGRVVFQWKTPAVAELVRVSGTDEMVQPGGGAGPLAVVARDKAGNAVENASVTFTIEDPDQQGAFFYVKGGADSTEVVVPTDARGRAESQPIQVGGEEGAFTVRAAVGGVSTVFSVQVKDSAYTVSVAGGDGQRAEQGTDFEEALAAEVVKSGTAAPAGTEVEFRVEDESEDAPRFADGERVVRVETDERGGATAPTLTAGEGTGTYTVTASVGGAMTQFAVEVVPGDGTQDPGPGDEPSGSPSPSAAPSPSAGTGGTTGGDGTSPGGTSTTGGTSTDLAGGSLASTGAGGIGLLAAAAAALAAVGFAAFRYGPRLSIRSRDHG
ncbi:hypothetical protein ABTZ58_04460 [Streptomyces sp. NPDC094143]|uniref:hypothetical protein n=1 Tax=Streptomyces sp. NPDC094143 TaxID=3155310 RepID=UPI00332D72D7